MRRLTEIICVVRSLAMKGLFGKHFLPFSSMDIDLMVLFHLE